jgi:predicted Ser/Thr protein kinase
MDYMLGFIMIVMGFILGKLVQELTQEERERRRIKKAWEAQHRKEWKE